MEDWELNQYRQAAEAACYRMRQSPHQMVSFPDGSIRPLWTEYARRMHEMRVMHEELRNHGMLPA